VKPRAARPSTRAILIAIAFAGGAALGSPVAADAVANVIERSRLEVQPSGKAFKQITIENALGDVVIEGYDGTSIQIESKKTAPDDEGLERLRISLVPNPDGTVRITTTADRDKENKPLARRAVRIDLKVRAPRNARIEATAGTGTLTMSNMDAGGDLDTASGSIKVHNVQGELTTHSISGNTSLASVFGSVDSQTLSSDLDLDSIAGERLTATANHGKIAGRRVRSREVQLTTTDGRIVLEAEAALRGRVIVASLKGDIDVRMRRNSGTSLVVRARAAKVDFGARVPQAQPQPVNGFVETRLGVTSGNPAVVEMRSRYGNVQFAIID
jgi:hypothetical protein